MLLRLFLILGLLQLSYCQKPKYITVTYTKVNWFRAQLICNRSNMTLASVPNIQSHYKVISSISEIAYLLGREKFWLGGNNLGDLSTWNWPGAGLPFGYKKWAENEPTSALTGEEACLVMAEDNDWYSEDCYNKYFFVCESKCDSNAAVEPIFI
ncbi:snaclec alboaggregin-D subunit beta [Drosophila nasuta]|uniref:snaclec alboaggregin-D subunit beta n=1 Tax=Drosophila nasuta TaxID=42062 RepID=UPI00295EC5A1|nr:snaclec alboaggregin-D subunit beta [Drosophila nasuta]